MWILDAYLITERTTLHLPVQGLVNEQAVGDEKVIVLVKGRQGKVVQPVCRALSFVPSRHVPPRLTVIPDSSLL